MNSKNLTVLFVACFLISGYFNFSQWQQRSSLHEEEEGARTELVEEQQLYKGLKDISSTATARVEDVQSVDKELVSLVFAARSDLPNQMITLSALTVSHSTSGPKGTALGSLFSPFARTDGLKSTNFKLNGKYRNLRLLQAYIAKLKARPAILSGLILDQDSFTLNILLIGK